MRLAGRLRMGHYPLALEEARRIRRFLSLPDGIFSAIDPCAGCGSAFIEITAGTGALRYGVELDAYRAEEAGRVLSHVIQGSCFDVHCPVESFSLAYLNPPYDWTGDERRSESRSHVPRPHLPMAEGRRCSSTRHSRPAHCSVRRCSCGSVPG